MCHVADVAAGLPRTLAQNGNVAARGLRQSGQRAQQSSLPCSVVAKNHVELASVELRAHAAQGGEAAELLDQIADGNKRCAARDVSVDHESQKILAA